MTLTPEGFLSLSIDIALALIMIAVTLSLVRLARGPSLPDRVVALDMMTVLIIAFCGVIAMDSDEAAILDIAVVLALIGFLATVALARFAERREAGSDG